MLVHLYYNIMAILEVSARQFRDKQKSFFEIADSGRQLVIKRGKKQSYILTPITQDDFIATPALLEKIEKSRQQMRDGNYVECKTFEDNLNFLNSKSASEIL